MRVAAMGLGWGVGLCLVTRAWVASPDSAPTIAFPEISGAAVVAGDRLMFAADDQAALGQPAVPGATKTAFAFFEKLSDLGPGQTLGAERLKRLDQLPRAPGLDAQRLKQVDIGEHDTPAAAVGPASRATAPADG